MRRWLKLLWNDRWMLLLCIITGSAFAWMCIQTISKGP